MPMKIVPDKNHLSIKWEGDIYYLHRGNDYYRRIVYRGKPRRYYYLKLKCSNCNKIVFRSRSNFRKLLGKGRTSTCNSPACISRIKTGENNANWSGGRKFKRGSKGGYVLVYAPDHPYARKNWIAEHRLIVEQNLGRYLTSEEIVHHIDCDPQNNTLGNLILCKDTAEHHTAHGTLNRCVKVLLQLGVLRFDKKLKKYTTDQ